MSFIQFLGQVLLGVIVCGVFGTPMLVQGATNSTKPHFRTVCYTEGWAHYRQDPVQFDPEDIDTSLCTHLIFAFALLDSATGLHLVPGDPSIDPQMYHRLTSLKREKPHLKVMLAVGGWVLGSDEFSMMVSSETNMHSFAMNAVEYLHRYDFDGLDIDWEYPGDRGSPAGDKQRFTQLLQILKKEFYRDHALTNRSRLLLSAAISPAPFRTAMSYQLPDIANYVDFLNVMTYDLHGSWDSKLGHHSALYSPTNDETDSIDYMVNWVLNTSVPRQKLNLGLSFYGRSLQLSNPQNAHVGADISGDAPGGELNKEQGIMLYYEVCKLLTEHSNNISDSGRLPGSQAPYVVDGSRWTGYDDVESVKEKVGYAMEHGLGGVFVWAIDMDDFHGICGGGHYPLMHAIKAQIHSAIIGR